MYTLTLSSGIVTRDSDGMIVAPVSNINDVHYQEYVSWVNAGNEPAVQRDTQENLLAAARDRMWKLIQSERERRRTGGVKVGTSWFHSDDSSRIQQLGLVMMGVNMPAGIMWKTMTGSFVQMTPTLAQQIFQSTAAQDTAIFGVAEQHRAQMIASSDPETYNYLTGWPLAFGE